MCQMLRLLGQGENDIDKKKHFSTLHSYLETFIFYTSVTCKMFSMKSDKQRVDLLKRIEVCFQE